MTAKSNAERMKIIIKINTCNGEDEKQKLVL